MLLAFLYFVADDVGVANGVMDAILRGGPWAIIFVLFLTDRLDTTGERNLLRLQLEQSQERERKLYESIRTELTPALSENTNVMVGAVKPMLERVSILIEVMERRLGREA